MDKYKIQYIKQLVKQDGIGSKKENDTPLLEGTLNGSALKIERVTINEVFEVKNIAQENVLGFG